MNYKVIAARFKKSFVSRKTKFLVAALLITTSSAFAQVPSYVPTNGLVGWWPFNGNANDESGNGNNGTVNGATLTSDRFGSLNSAYSFNNNEITTNISSVKFSSDYTISIWVRANPNNQTYPTFLCGNNVLSGWTDPNYLETNLYQNKFVHYLQIAPQNAGQVLYQSNTITLNTWYHLVISNVNQQCNMYVNGIFNSTIGPIYLSNLGAYLHIGNGRGNGEIFIGQLDDIGIWNRALTQQEITALYNAQSCTGTGAITADGPTTFCAGNYVNLTSDVVGGTYQWKKNGLNITTNGTSRTYKATATGSYTCVATCNGTALTSNAIQVTTKTNAFASVTANGATSFCLGDSVTLNCTNLGSNYSVQWYRTNISMENATNYSLVVKQPGTYKVVTRNLTNGCSRISGSAITTSVNCRIAGDITSGTTTEENTTNAARLIDNELSQGVHIYPNPNNGSFNFTYDGEETGDGILQIINTMGQSIYNSAVTVQEGGYTQEIQLGDNYNKGFYIVRLLINGSYHDSRVMVR